MADPLVRSERIGDVVVLTLDDPPTRNALSWAMADVLHAALEETRDARALVLAGAGKGFCSGGDLRMDGAGEEGFGEVLRQGIARSINPLMLALADLEIPVIALVHGAAAGAGASLAISADFTIMAEDGFLLLAFPRVGLALDAGASWMLPRLIGPARATRALMLAEPIHARQACEWGIAHEVVPAADLREHGLALAQRLAEGPTTAYGEIRRAVRLAQSSSYAEALQRECEAQQRTGDTADCREAIAAFGEKRTPAFIGR
ncbi:MAG: enoyl-CoA hydratase/isomerase family protein [Erythrobacter sp.]|nr:MAG: enoyl-CoA hydratase/isomerase family protein [Erythrobacter sp.]